MITNTDLKFNDPSKIILEWGNYGDGTYQLKDSILEIPIYVSVGENGRLAGFWGRSQIGDNRSVMIPEGMLNIHIDSDTQITVSGAVAPNWVLRSISTL